MIPFLLLLAGLLPAQTQPEHVQTLVLNQPWRFHTGDNPQWKDPGFDDSHWVPILPSSSWTEQGVIRDPSGFAWYRLVVTIETSEPLYLWFPELRTSAEVFVNGAKVLQYGTPGNVFLSKVHMVPLAPLPALKSGDRALIAIRVWQCLDDEASHLGGGISAAPELGPRRPMERALNLQSQERQLDYLSFLLTSLLGLFLAAVFIVCWRRQAHHPEYGWYAGMLFGRAMFDALWYGLFAVGFYRGAGLFAGFAYAVNLGCSYYFFRSYFRAPAPRWHRWVLGVCLLLVAADGCGWVDWLMSSTTNSLLIAGQLPILGANAAVLIGEGRKRKGEAWLLGVPYCLYASGLIARITWGVLIFSGFYSGFPDNGLLLLREPIAVPLELAGLVMGSLAMAGILLNRFTRIALEGERLTKELEAARQVQELLLPEAAARVPGFVIDSSYFPANEVGGDFYQIQPCEPGGMIVVVGDVSGKGLKAAMLVSVAIGILRNEKSTSPSMILSSLNEGLAGHTAGGFVTCCCARFDADGTVTLANAGHPPPYCDEQEVEVEAALPLGIAAGVPYTESTTTGRSFAFVSDGVVEAANTRGELFGFERTQRMSSQPAREIAQAAKAWGQNDDITVVTVRRVT